MRIYQHISLLLALPKWLLVNPKTVWILGDSEWFLLFKVSNYLQEYYVILCNKENLLALCQQDNPLGYLFGVSRRWIRPYHKHMHCVYRSNTSRTILQLIASSGILLWCRVHSELDPCIMHGRPCLCWCESLGWLLRWISSINKIHV